MTWRWLVFWKREPTNGHAAQLAAEQAATDLSRAHQQARKVERVAGHAAELADHADWFTQRMEQALHRRRSA